MTFKNIGKNKLISFEPKPRSIYSILSIAFFVLLIALSLFIGVYFQGQWIKVLAILFVPLALIIFLLKIVVWNFFGQETILIKPNSLESSLFYNYIYKAQLNNYKYSKYSILLRSNKNPELIDIATALNDEYIKGKFKLHFKFSEENNFESARSITQDELKLLINELSISPQKTSNKPL